MKKLSPPENIMAEIIRQCNESLNKIKGVATLVSSETELAVSAHDKGWSLEIDGCNEPDADQAKQKPISDNHKRNIKKINDHFNVLEASLAGIANNPKLAPFITDLSVDGDNRDCEAIFNTPEGYLVLKVR